MRRANALGGVVDELELEEPLDRPVPRRRRTVALAAIVSLALVAAAAIAIQSQQADDDEAETASLAAAPARYFVLDGLGSDWGPFVLSGGGASPAVRTQLFGHPNKDDPFTKSDAFVVTVSVDESVGLSDDGERVTVRGQPAAVELGQRDPWGPVDVLRYRVDSQLVTIYSRHLGRDGLLSFADALDPVSLRLTREVRDLRPLGNGDDLPIPASPGRDRQRVAYIGSGMVALSAQPGGRESLRSLRWFGGEPTTVDGRPAMRYRSSASASGDGSHSYAWQLEDGTVLSIEVNGAAVDPLALAATVREVTAGDWSALRGPVAAVYDTPMFGSGVTVRRAVGWAYGPLDTVPATTR